MSAKVWKLGIFGCGDFLRWQADAIKKSTRVEVAALYDPDTGRAQSYAEALGGRAVASEDAIFDDKSIEAVCLFVPPWLRRGLIERAVATGKHILATKPLGASIEDVDAIVEVISDRVRCGVFYGRTGDDWAETARETFEEGAYGKLALYRQDWIHHYPTWNKWAILPEKNGGPFMDAMIHNFNLARHLMGRPLKTATFFSDRLAHPDLTCADTEMLKADFEDGGSAYLFITWAADLEVYNDEGNNRDHIDLFYLVSDQGWHITRVDYEGRPALRLTREGKEIFIPARELPSTPYNRFFAALENGAPNPPDIPDAAYAASDIRVLRQLGQGAFARLESL